MRKGRKCMKGRERCGRVWKHETIEARGQWGCDNRLGDGSVADTQWGVHGVGEGRHREGTHMGGARIEND